MTGPDFTGRTAVITGGSRGIGLAIGKRLAAGGANVVVTSRKQESAEAAAAEIGAGALGIGAHAAHEDEAKRCMEQTVKQFGGIDILVNNAGTNPAFGPLIEQDHARFAKIFDINLWAPLLWTSLAVDAGLGRRDGHSGSVINIASIGGLTFEAGMGLYNATKAALIHITKQQALELGPKIRVNAICPGVVRTRLAELLWKEHEEALSTVTALGRIGEPPDIAEAAAFLSSDAAGWITGEIMVVDGGQLLGNAAMFRAGGDG